MPTVHVNIGLGFGGAGKGVGMYFRYISSSRIKVAYPMGLRSVSSVNAFSICLRLIICRV